MTAYYKDTFFTYKSFDLFNKAKRDFKNLKEEINTDSIFNFFVTAYHLKDYLKNEFDDIEENEIRNFENMDELLNIAGFIANKGKHFQLNNSRYEEMETRYYSGKFDGTMLFDGTFKFGEEEKYKVKIGNEVFEVEKIAVELINCWENFLKEKGII